MHTNNLDYFFADNEGLTFHHAAGNATASVTAQGVDAYTTLRPEEADYLQEVAVDFPRYHAANFDGENYNKQFCPLQKP